MTKIRITNPMEIGGVFKLPGVYDLSLDAVKEAEAKGAERLYEVKKEVKNTSEKKTKKKKSTSKK